MIRTVSTVALAAFAAYAALAGNVQAQTTTDEAREMASRAFAQQRLRMAFVKPEPVSVATGDYRAQAHNEALEANYRAMAEAVLAYGSGARSQALKVNSEDSARAEAARIWKERHIAELHGLLADSAEARRDLEEGLQAGPRLAKR